MCLRVCDYNKKENERNWQKLEKCVKKDEKKIIVRKCLTEQNKGNV